MRSHRLALVVGLLAVWMMLALPGFLSARPAGKQHEARVAQAGSQPQAGEEQPDGDQPDEENGEQPQPDEDQPGEENGEQPQPGEDQPSDEQEPCPDGKAPSDEDGGESGGGDDTEGDGSEPQDGAGDETGGGTNDLRRDVVEGSYIVVYEKSVETPRRKTEELRRACDIDVEHRYGRVLKGFSAELSGEQVEELEEEPGVAAVVPDRRVKATAMAPIVSGDSAPTGVRRIGAATTTTAHQASTVNVAVLDTGIDLDHRDLTVVNGTDCVGGRTADDDNGHGTRVAGPLAARNSGVGVVGVVPGTRLYAVKVLDSGAGGAHSQIICGIEWVTATRSDGDSSNDISVANMSFEGVGQSVRSCDQTTDPLHLAICASTRAGVTYVAAAGDDASAFDAASAPSTPAAYPEVLTVTAMADRDGSGGGLGGGFCGQTDDRYATSSSFALTDAGERHTIAAPGVCVKSTVPGGGFGNSSGTSLAAPHVAGAVALCLGEAGQTGPCDGMTPAQIIDHMRAQAEAQRRRNAAFGFVGDPLSPAGDKYFGYLVFPEVVSDRGATLYVDSASKGGQCSDARTGSQVSLTTPLCTLPRAAELIADGGTILVRAGAYPKLTADRAFTTRTTFKAYAGEQPVLAGVSLLAAARNIRLEGFRVTDITQTEGEYLELVGNDMSPHGVVLHGNNNLAERNTIHDLRIVFDVNSTASRCHTRWKLNSEGGENDADGDGEYDYPLSETGGIAPWCGYAFRVRGASLTIRNNFVKKVPADAVQASVTTNLLVEGNHFEDVAVQSSADGGDPLEHPDGAQVIGENTSPVFRNNVFIDTRGILPMLGAQNKWPTNVRVENNVFHTATKESGGGIGCVHASAVTGMTIVNNTCWGTGSFDPRIRITDGTPTTSEISETTGVVLRNNVMERLVTERIVGIDEDYNLIRRYEAPDHLPGSHSIIDREPTFVAGDLRLHLAAGSAGIDAATSDGAPDRDRESGVRCDEPTVANTGGGARPYFDIGAHEFGSGESTCASTPPPEPPQPPPASTYADVVVADGPTSYWRVGESSGGVANDVMTANRGTYVGGFTLGQPGAVTGDTAVRLNGSSGYVKVPDSASLDTGDNFTIEMWVKRGRLGISQGLATKRSYLIFLDGSNYVNLRKANVGNIVRSTVPISDTSAYHHIVVAKAGPATRIYIDGVNRTGTVTNRTITDTTSPLLLGTGTGYLNGTLDEVALYRRGLTASEVAEHYAAR